MADPNAELANAAQRISSVLNSLHVVVAELTDLADQLKRADTSHDHQYAADILMLEASSTMERIDALAHRQEMLQQRLDDLADRHDMALAEEEAATQTLQQAVYKLGSAEAEADLDPNGTQDALRWLEDAQMNAAAAAAELAHVIARRAEIVQETAQVKAVLDAEKNRLEELHSRLIAQRSVPNQDRPVRELVLDALAEIGVPCPSNLLGRYVHARFGREIKSTRWGPLRADERSAQQRASEADDDRVWLQPATTSSGDELTRLWVRSDWQPNHRVVDDPADRLLLEVRACRLAELAIDPPDGTTDPDAIKQITIDEADRTRHQFHPHQGPDRFLTQLAQQADYVHWPRSEDSVPF